MPNVGVEKHWRDKCLSPKRQSGTNAGVGQTQDFWDKHRSGQTQESQTFFSILNFFDTNTAPPYLRPVTFLS